MPERTSTIPKSGYRKPPPPCGARLCPAWWCVWTLALVSLLVDQTLAKAPPRRDEPHHAVSSATVKGPEPNRTYAYDAAGHVTSDGKRSYTWSSTGQLASLIYLNAPAIHQVGGTLVFAAASVRCDFAFDAAGSRSRQTKERTAPNDSRVIEETLYLGAYEREIHSTRASGTAPFVTTKTLHRHSLPGGAVYTRKVDAGGTETRLAAVIRDHLGSTDVILTATWDNAQAVFATPQTERQSFDPWGERRSPFTLAAFRQADADPFRTSAQDHDRGYTGHEKLDDSGLIHMNGRIYDPELGRMLSPDPIVQVPEYSQNHNRYSYVLNNPLNLTDPTGYSWISDAFHKLGNWIKENWRQVVATVVSIVLGAITGGLALAFVVPALGITSGTLAAAMVAGAIAGSVAGMASTAIMGGSWRDILKAGIMGGLIGGLVAGAQYLGMEAMYNQFYGEDLKNLDVYEVTDAKKAMSESMRFRKEYVQGASRKITNWQELHAWRGKIWVNGQSNDYFKALDLGARYTESSRFLMLHNPTSSGLMDTIESGLDKISGATPISRQVAKVLAMVDPKCTVYAHSQGTILVRNAINLAAQQGANVTGFAINFDGAAVNHLSTNLNLRGLGAPRLNSFQSHSLDAVPNIVGYNALSIFNPVRLVGSVVASPLLGVGNEWSPHTYRGGGAYLRWFPDWY